MSKEAFSKVILTKNLEKKPSLYLKFLELFKKRSFNFFTKNFYLRLFYKLLGGLKMACSTEKKAKKKKAEEKKAEAK